MTEYQQGQCAFVFFKYKIEANLATISSVINDDCY